MFGIKLHVYCFFISMVIKYTIPSVSVIIFSRFYLKISRVGSKFGLLGEQTRDIYNESAVGGAAFNLTRKRHVVYTQSLSSASLTHHLSLFNAPKSYIIQVYVIVRCKFSFYSPEGVISTLEDGLDFLTSLFWSPKGDDPQNR